MESLRGDSSELHTKVAHSPQLVTHTVAGDSRLTTMRLVDQPGRKNSLLSIVKKGESFSEY